MPDLAAVDMPDGLTPYGPVLRANYYSIVTSNAVAVYHGALMEAVGTTYYTPVFGNLPAAISEETGAAGTIIGAVLAIYDHNFCPVLYLPASTTGNGVIAGYALIADHSEQVYIAQEDGDTSSIVAANIGLAADMVGTTGSTVTGRSYMEIDSNTIAGTATLALHVIGVHPEDTISSAGAAGNHCRFLVKINAAYKDAATAGA
jgi:hypothetical protein